MTAVVYPKGATKPSNVLCCVSSSFGIAVDRHHDVYESSWRGSQGPLVAVYHEGALAKALPLTGLSVPMGIDFDNHGNLVVIDAVSGILIYSPPYSGAPTRTIATRGTSAWGKLNRANTRIYVSDVASGAVDVYMYPSGVYQYSITAGLSASGSVSGIAIVPAGK